MITETIITFQSYDGYSLEGTFLHAEHEKAAVLFVHGITSSRDELGFHSDYAAFLAVNGISSFRFDLRYHGVNETLLTELTLSGIVNDIDAAFNSLKGQIGENTNAFFIIGTSFGGGLSAYWAEFNHKGSIKKVILNAPVLDYENDVLDRNGLLTGGVLSPKAKQQLMKKKFVDSSDIHFGRGLINELRYINGIRSVKHLGDKVVIFHGREDEDVPLAMSKKYKSKKNRLIIIDNVGHGFGVEDDEELDFPETKAIHGQIYATALKLMNKCL
jgi:pimeloyl-ACP methyl ester carboxylesterase